MGGDADGETIWNAIGNCRAMRQFPLVPVDRSLESFAKLTFSILEFVSLPADVVRERELNQGSFRRRTPPIVDGEVHESAHNRPCNITTNRACWRKTAIH